MVAIVSWLHRHHWIVLAGVLGMAASGVLFLELADDVLEGEFRNLDRTILMSMRNRVDPADPVGPIWFEEGVRDITALGSYSVLGLTTVAAVGYLLMSGRSRIAAVILLATLGGTAVGTVLKGAYERDRPDLAVHHTRVSTASFPSGHSMLAASTYLTLGVILAASERRRRIKAYLLGLSVTVTVLVGISRVYLGVHWPTDVVAGWIAGTGWALACWITARWLWFPSSVASN